MVLEKKGWACQNFGVLLAVRIYSNDDISITTNRVSQNLPYGLESKLRAEQRHLSIPTFNRKGYPRDELLTVVL